MRTRKEIEARVRALVDDGGQSGPVIDALQWVLAADDVPGPISESACPDCKTTLVPIDQRPGKEAWCCPVALEAQRRGLLGKPGRKHKHVWVWEPKRKEAHGTVCNATVGDDSRTSQVAGATNAGTGTNRQAA